MEFIAHPNAEEVCKALAECISESQIGIVSGPVQTGKSRLLQHMTDKYWQRENSGVQPRILCAQLWEPPSVRKFGYMTSIAGITFTEITVALGPVSQRHSSPLIHETKRWYNRPRSVASDAQFASLFAFVRTEIQRLHISALLIDNAGLLDSFTIERLVDCRRVRQNHLAIIFAETQENPTKDSQLVRLVETFTRADERIALQVLPRLTQAETCNRIMVELIKRHARELQPGLTPADLVQMRKMFWEKTQGRWDEITAVAQRMDRTLGRTTPKSILTKERWESILEATYALRQT